MEEEFLILESRMNWLSDFELDYIKPKPLQPIINKLAELSEKDYKRRMAYFKNLSQVLTRIDSDLPVKEKKAPRYITYNTKKGCYIAVMTIRGKRVHVKSSKDITKVEQALKDFCKTHNIEIK